MESSTQKWSAAIKALLEDHGLSLRGAAQKVGRPALRTYLADWMAGQVPQYKTAVDFLEHFPREEAIKCLEAAGYPIPSDWQDRPQNAIEAVEFGLRGSGLSEEGQRQIVDLAREIEERERKKREEGK